jgi:hypothetical protein
VTTIEQDRAISDPVGLITDLIAAADPSLAPERIHSTVVTVAGGRAKSRRLAAALASRPGILLDGRSPAPRAVGELLMALRAAEPATISLPRCAACGKPLQTFTRKGRDWYCVSCEHRRACCAGCGKTKRVKIIDRDGQPRCAQCCDVDDRDPISVIHSVVSELDPRLDRDMIAASVIQSCRQGAYQQKLAWAIESDPALLTGEGHRAPLRVIPRFVERLHAAGVAGIVLPACPGCHRVVRIDKPLNGVRVCRTCIAHSRIEECSRCRARREPVTRDEDGGPICANCFTTDPANLETCIGCGRRRSVSRRTADGPLCPTCLALPVRTCFLCGDTTPCGISRTTGRPWCPTCQRRTANCSSCAQPAPVAAGTLTHPLCADCAPPPAWLECPSCSDPGHPKPGQCGRCRINRRLDEIMGPASTDLPAGLLALRHEIATAEHSITANRWLTKQPTVSVLADLAAGRMPLTHDAFDQLPKRPVVEHLRLTLVAVGALPERDEELVRLEQALTDFLAQQQDLNRRRILHRYLIWNLLRRLRSRNNGRPTTRQQVLRIRLHRRATEAFLDWLDAHQLTLETVGQPELERWLNDPAGSYRYETATFIRWAHANKLTTGYPQAKRWHGPVNALNDDQRWATARQLLHDTTIDAEDRLAGLLLLLFAQRPSAIALLTTDQITISSDDVSISFGRTPIRLPHPADELARDVVATRKGHATIGAAAPSRWLFPGGQPGRPISTERLKQRLNQLGIRPNQARSTALFQLATEIPAAILARTLGISVNSAVRWQQISAGDWASYAADVSNRSRPQRVDPTDQR